jgi:hypothetical protein
VAEAQLLPVLGLDFGREGGSRTFLQLGVLFLYVSNNVLTKVHFWCSQGGHNLFCDVFLNLISHVLPNWSSTCIEMLYFEVDSSF